MATPPFAKPTSLLPRFKVGHTVKCGKRERRSASPIKGGMRKCGKREGRLGQGRLVGVPEFGARIRDFGEIHSPQITGCKCPLGIPTPPITKVRTNSGRAGGSDGASASVHHEVRIGVRHVLCAPDMAMTPRPR